MNSFGMVPSSTAAGRGAECFSSSSPFDGGNSLVVVFDPTECFPSHDGYQMSQSTDVCISLWALLLIENLIHSLSHALTQENYRTSPAYL